MIQPGETVTHSFLIPFAKESIAKVYVTYNQNDFNVITKIIEPAYIFASEDTSSNQSHFDVFLTQDESLRFSDGINCYIQVNVVCGDGTKRYPSLPIAERCGTQYLKKVIE